MTFLSVSIITFIIISKDEVNACTLLKENKSTRIPKEYIEEYLNELIKDTVKN